MEMTVGLVCRGLDFRWPDDAGTPRTVLTSVNVGFAPGTVSLITGATGAGKSTLLHLLGGLLRPTAGEIWADGQAVSRWPPSHRDPWRRRVGIVFQHLALASDLTAAENLLLPLLPRAIPWTHMQTDIRRQLAEADLIEQAGSPVRRLSGGQRQRLALARALVGAPRFILADEPTAFQDDGHAAWMRGRLRTAAEQDAVVVVCSQDPRWRRSSIVDQHLHLSGGTLAPAPHQGWTP